MYTSWRCSQGWANSGLSLSSISDQTCQLFDSALTQYVSWCEYEQYGGLENTLKQMKATDPHFVMGHVLSFGLDLLSTSRSIHNDSFFCEQLTHLKNLSKIQQITPRESLHVEAISVWAKGDLYEAANTWEDILIQHPTDMLAIKFAHDTYFFTGQREKIRDSIARVLPLWDVSKPLYGYLHGMYAFGLVETNFYDKALQMGEQGLKYNSQDAWSTHAIAHVNEMQGKTDEGIKFMADTHSDWSKCGLLACHNYWHWALYYIENGEQGEALNLYEKYVREMAKDGGLLNIVDAASLLMRLEMEGVSAKPYWRELYEICKPHLEDQVLAFNNLHFLFACLGSKETEAVDKMKRELKISFNESKCFYNSTLGIEEKLYEAVIAFDAQDYSTTVNVLEPIRYNIHTIGGSNAQRDIFTIMLIVAALKSPDPKHNKLARHLVYEREALKVNSPMTKRLMAQSIAQH